MVSLMGPRRTRTRIGLDLGESGARAVQLACNGDCFSVSEAALSEWAGSDSKQEIPVDQLGDRIQRCVRSEHFRGRSVVAALNPPAIEFHSLDLPAVVLKDPKADLAEVIRWEVGRLINQPLEGVETRHWPLPPTQVPGPNAIGVSARGDSVTRVLEACSHAGLVCSCVDTGASALSRFGGLLNQWRPDQIWGVLDVGSRDARLTLCVDGVPVLMRRAGSGGQLWTERVAGALQVSIKAAEVHKRDHGIAATGRGVRHGEHSAPSRELASILLSTLRGELKDMASEIKRSYEYVLSCYPDRHAADLVLAGGGVAMRNLPEFLSDSLGIPVQRASDYLGGENCRLRYASGKQRRLEVLASAIGLAVE